MSAIVLHVAARLGFSVEEISREVVALADELAIDVQCEVNGVHLVGQPGGSATVLAENYGAALGRPVMVATSRSAP